MDLGRNGEERIERGIWEKGTKRGRKGERNGEGGIELGDFA